VVQNTGSSETQSPKDTICYLLITNPGTDPIELIEQVKVSFVDLVDILYI
jgi:hypothetical protein